jgi:HD-GYP domain-containing protein (c-di-GMP phosphodiesterase class II)
MSVLSTERVGAVERILINEFCRDFYKLSGKEITVYLRREGATPRRKSKPQIQLEDLLNITNKYIPHDMRRQGVISINDKRRYRVLSDLRKVFGAIASHQGYSHESIANVINRERSSVTIAISACNDLMQTDEVMRELYASIQEEAVQSTIKNHLTEIEHEPVLHRDDQSTIDSEQALPALFD